jgi:glycine cleavage system H lipoate-binding protein
METYSACMTPAGNPPCIWMQAGVVNQRMCRTDFECTACSYDRALRRTARENHRLRERGAIPVGKRSRIVSWQDALRMLPPWKRPCLHHMKQRIGYRTCTHDYLCANCDFDQFFNDQFTVFALVRPVDVLDIKGIRFPQGYYLHPGHCWVKIEESTTVRVGLDDFALRVLGPPDRIESPLIGKELTQHTAAINLNREAHAATLLAPVSGVVTEINPDLREKGALAGAAPYTEGWVLRLNAPDLRRQLRGLMFGEEASRFLDAEIERVYELIDQAAGPLAADGGRLGSDLFGHLPQIGWETLTAAFLRTGPHGSIHSGDGGGPDRA